MLPRRVRVARRLARELPPARCGVAWVPRLEVPGADGETLLADHYLPRTGEDRGTILVRTPYGRGFPWAHLYGVAFAEQGFHVLMQSCRGTSGSTGKYEPPGHDRSHLGYFQLALAADPPPELKAAVVQVGIHDAGSGFPGCCRSARRPARRSASRCRT